MCCKECVEYPKRAGGGAVNNGFDDKLKNGLSTSTQGTFSAADGKGHSAGILGRVKALVEISEIDRRIILRYGVQEQSVLAVSC